MLRSRTHGLHCAGLGGHRVGADPVTSEGRHSEQYRTVHGTPGDSPENISEVSQCRL